MLQALQSQNGRAFGITLGGAISYVAACSLIGKTRLLPARLSRKLMHIGTGPLFMLCWPLYTMAARSRWLAAAVPALAGVQFALVGAGLIRDDTLVAGASRSGRREELLRGPLLYAAVHVAVALLAWRTSPSGILALSVLCGGDGLAEVVGRGCSVAAAAADAPPKHPRGGRAPRRASWLLRVGATPLPWNRGKTVAGSVACWLGGAAAALPLLAHFQQKGMFGPPAAALGGWRLLRGVLFCSAVGAAAESVPLGGTEAGLDNVTITLAVALCSRLYFGS